MTASHVMVVFSIEDDTPVILGGYDVVLGVV